MDPEAQQTELPITSKGPLVLEDAWARPTPPGRAMSALYGSLTNYGEDVITIRGFSSDRTTVIELHESVLVDGVSRMRPLELPALAQGESLDLQPGGAHLMLMGIDLPLADKQLIKLTVTTSEGEHQFSVPVGQ